MKESRTDEIAHQSKLQKNWEKWERFRESKMEKMRMHKKNIERRMQNECRNDWSYWSQRRDSLKRYPKQESLDPSWYTDNIYSNHSLDLDGNDVMPDFDNFDRFLEQRNSDHYGRNMNAGYGRGHVDVNDNSDQLDDDDDLFECDPRAKHATGNLLPVNRDYRYPKSRSCCFGGGYETQKTVSLLPKSSTFSTARAKANLAKIREVRSNYDQRPRMECCTRNVPREDDVVVERLTYRRSVGTQDEDRERMLDNDFCYSRRRSDRNRYYDEDDFENAIRTGKPEIDRMRNKSDYIRNEWLIKNKPKAIGDLNGNVCDEDDQLDEISNFDDMDAPAAYGYHDERPGQRRRMSFDSDLDYTKGNDRDTYYKDIDVLEQEFEDEAAGVDRKYYPFGYRRPPVRSKRALEVRAPNRFDDTSSDSTDVDLDDFNFDFEKYWEDLDKTNTAYDIDIRNNNTYNNLNRVQKKVKKINVSRYNNVRRAPSQFKERYMNNMLNHSKPHSNLLESLLAPSSESSVVENHDCESDLPVRPNTLPLYRYGHKIYPADRLTYNHFNDPTLPPYPPPPPPILKHPSPRNLLLLPPAQPHPSSQRYPSHMLSNHNNSSSNPGNTTNPFSLISNIFSIYKPKKYSPLNCNSTLHPSHFTDDDHNMNHNLNHSNHSSKIFRASKKMNVASTIRPLGAPANDFITSLKRPLMVTPSPCVEQPHFKIIPEKTGLKISPLYRFDYDNGERKFMLRSTARPLMMFPQ